MSKKQEITSNLTHQQCPLILEDLRSLVTCVLVNYLKSALFQMV